MSKEPDILPEDHEQYEREYYDRQLEQAEKSCLFSAKSLLMIIVILTLIACFSSCVSMKYPPVTVATGTVISVDGDNVLVAFEVINKTKGAQGSNWFYCPRHVYSKGDRYPDPGKHPNPERP